MPKLVWLNGKLVPTDKAVINVYDHGLLYGDGVFEGIRVYNGRIFKLATHMKRLYESAKSIHLDVPYTIQQLTQAVRRTVTANKRRDGYIRLCVTRGVGTLGINPNNCQTPSIFIIVDSIALYPAELYKTGMAVIVSSFIRNHPAAFPAQVKSLNYLNNILAKIEAIEAGVPEAVMLNHQGYVSECTGDNIFIVRSRNGKKTLLTTPIHSGILEGVTRGAILGLAKKLRIPALEADLTRHDLYTADEMFLTGSGAEVIAVTSIDSRRIGAGKPGPITGRLLAAFHKLVGRNAPED